MLKMGRMCHCKRTLWKIDPSNGSIVWSKDRGADSLALSYLVDGSDLWLFESGEPTSGDGVAAGWLSASGASPSKEWEFTDADSLDVRDIQIDADGAVVWLANRKASTKHLTRLDYSDGSELSESGATGETDQLLYQAPTSSMNVHDGGGNRLRQYNSSFTVLATRTLFSGSAVSAKAAGDSAANGFVDREASGLAGILRNVDSALSLVATAAVDRNVMDATSTKTLVFSGTTMELRTISGFGLDWSATTALGTTAGHLDASHNAYTIESSNSVKRRAAATGAVDWTNTDFTSISAKQIDDGTNLYLVGRMLLSGVEKRVAAINLSTGTTAWTTAISAVSSEVLRDGLISGSYLYVCGDRQ